jgi:hypothetical protein
MDTIFTVTLGHSCHWCHRWIKIGETARYFRYGDSAQIYCTDCDAKSAKALTDFGHSDGSFQAQLDAVKSLVR